MELFLVKNPFAMRQRIVIPAGTPYRLPQSSRQDVWRTTRRRRRATVTLAHDGINSARPMIYVDPRFGPPRRYTVTDEMLEANGEGPFDQALLSSPAPAPTPLPGLVHDEEAPDVWLPDRPAQVPCAFDPGRVRRASTCPQRLHVARDHH